MEKNEIVKTPTFLEAIFLRKSLVLAEMAVAKASKNQSMNEVFEEK